jgi:transcriptional antiterminator RfaH
VRQRLSLFAEEVYLPLLKTKRPGQVVGQIEPLFPSYLFARLRLGERRYRLLHTSGVTAIVSAGEEPCELDAAIVDDMRSRETNGVIVLNTKSFQSREQPTIVRGTVGHLDALFQGYLSGTERVAILMNRIGGVMS